MHYDRLISGGIITNYDCSSKCKHCVYASSPEWPKDYLTAERADAIFQTIKQLGCTSVHIGGGEPLLHPDSLFPILNSAEKNGIDIEYIETNASWYRDIPHALRLFDALQKHRVHTLLISIDPFHNEFIPFFKVKGAMEACRQSGMEPFPWLMEFWDDLNTMADDKTHALAEYEKVFGAEYQKNLIKRYRLNMRGRALQTYRSVLKAVPVSKILAESSPCRELSGVHHFHIDLYGNFIPQSCAGLSIHFMDLLSGVSREKYPILHTLGTEGVKGLCHLAETKYGFTPKESYTGKCDLCYDIRFYLVMQLKLNLPDLQPLGHYQFI